MELPSVDETASLYPPNPNFENPEPFRSEQKCRCRIVNDVVRHDPSFSSQLAPPALSFVVQLCLANKLRQDHQIVSSMVGIRS